MYLDFRKGEARLFPSFFGFSRVHLYHGAEYLKFEPVRLGCWCRWLPVQYVAALSVQEGI